MQFFGVPKCPYCKKRVNLIRTWSLKRQGEYQCPRCGGISNIFLSPLIYVLALLAVFSGGAVYFFHKFVLNDITLSTAVQVMVPFAAFFLLSLFMVYLAKPVIKKVPKAEMDRKRRPSAGPESRRRAQPAEVNDDFRDEEYLPRSEYLPGPMPELDSGREQIALPEPIAVTGPIGALLVRGGQTAPGGAPAPSAAPEKAVPATAVPAKAAPVPGTAREAPKKPGTSSRTAGTSSQPSRAAESRKKGTPAEEDGMTARPAGRVEPGPAKAAPAKAASQKAKKPAAATAEKAPEPAAKKTFRMDPGAIPEPEVPVQQDLSEVFEVTAPRVPTRTRTIPKITDETLAAAEHGGEEAAGEEAEQAKAHTAADDFLAKYDDPAYVERRLKELQSKRDGET